MKGEGILKKVAVVTGGSRGIGYGIARQLVEDGYIVAVIDKNPKSAYEKELDALTAAEPKCIYYEGSITSREDREGFVALVAEQLGQIDVLVNNAGVTILESIFDLTEKNMDYLYHLLFRNYVILMREAATYMAENRIRGSIINISSVRGYSAHPGDLVYGGIKAALNRACQSVALDVAPYGIRVNNILPGATRRFTSEEEKLADPAHVEKIRFLSGRIPLERYGTPEDIGNAVVFLASEKASYITGISLVVDGGLSLPGLAETAAEAESGWGRVVRDF